MTTALSLVREQSVTEHTPEEWQALKETVAKGTSPAQFHVFVAACRSLGLDPFLKQVYCWIDSNSQGGITIYTAVAGLRALAKRTGHYIGQRGPFWCGKDGQWTDEWISAEPPVAAKFGVVSDEWDQPIWAVARLASYKKNSPFWNNAPEHKLAMVAESLAIRRAFPDSTSGVYTDAELGSGTVERPQDYVDAEPVTPRTATVQHGGHTVDRATGEVVDAETAADAAQEAQNAADDAKWTGDLPKSGRLKWSDLHARAQAARLSEDEWRDIVTEQTGKLKGFSAEDWHAVDAYLTRYEQTQARLAEATTAEPTAPDNGDPNLLRDLPALQGSVRP